FKVGIAWQGSASYHHDRCRSIPLAEFAPLADLPGVTLVSLQKGFGSEQVAALGGRFSVVELGPRLDESAAFVDTAAVMKNLDLVITSDTATPHLAGALGVPVWMATPFSPDWRWLLDRDDSPWYPTARLFRQPVTGDWDSVFQRVREELPYLVMRGEGVTTGAAPPVEAEAAALIRHGNELFRLDRFQDAIAAYDAALHTEPDNRGALYNRGNALFGLRRFTEALACYDAVLRVSPGDAKAHNNRGNALRELGRLQEALESYDHALQYAPDQAEPAPETGDRAQTIATLCNRAAVLTDMRRVAEALETYERILELNPDHAEARFDASLCHLVTGDFATGWA
ncbi:MAG: tetratricopeptide repeat protein, partial [Gemmataceae bacterium]